MFLSCHYTYVISITTFCLLIYCCFLTQFNYIYFLSIEDTRRKSHDDLNIKYAAKQKEWSKNINEECNVLFTKEMVLYRDKCLKRKIQITLFLVRNIFYAIFYSLLFIKPLHIIWFDSQLLVMFFLSIHL